MVDGSWTGDSWTGDAWPEDSWTGDTLPDETWTGDSWPEDSLTGDVWPGDGSADETWMGDTGSDDSWTGDTWLDETWIGDTGSDDTWQDDTGSDDTWQTDTGSGDTWQDDTWPDDIGPWDTWPDDTEQVATQRVRVMAANLTSGNYQNYDPGHGIRIFQGLVPDVVLIQELNYKTNSSKDIRALVELAFGDDFDFYREPKGDLPNGVISRWPIIEAGSWDDASTSNREFAWARIDIPGPVDLFAVSVHLLTKSEADRQKEATQLVAYIAAQVPADVYLVVGGDMNTAVAEEPALATMQDALTWTHNPADAAGNPNTNQKRTKPYDWLIPDDALEALHAPVVIGDNEFPDGLVFDSRVYTPLADVAPVKAADSDAASMQHMGVVKDFLVPLD